ncbi:hypothetical protein [Tenacibaculum maritimum]|uniref:hypothetical protein n=1 Tax=Tenacibaculum maritimum TaxID=107401 RepID=UPI0012E5D9E6|nr:hypothetical protein [Tenacibaculum maritimum]CAA0220261.1 hypothetical protein CVI1001048_340003 [Tenacibaculum maritimum]
MSIFETNQYIELYNPLRNNYFPVRILERTKDGYLVHSLIINKEINIYDFQLKTYGYRNTWISQELLERIGFKKDGLIYTLGNIIIWECLTGELNKIDHPYYLYKYKSKHLGYAILSENEIEDFKNDFQKIENEKIRERYSFISSMNEVFDYLLEQKPREFSYEKFDKIIIDK